MTSVLKSRVAVLGLGLMGSAVARRLVATGWNPLVWNRTPEKTAALVAAGARSAQTAEEAWSAADIILMVPLNYEAAYAMLGGRDAKPDFGAKTIVLLANGTASDARDFAAWATARAASYLDGNITCYPDKIGDEDSSTIYCGDTRVLEQARSVLAAVTGKVVHVSQDPAAGNAAEIAMASYIYGSIASLFQASLLCEAEGQDVGVLVSMIRATQPETDRIFDAVVEVSRNNPPQAPALKASLLTHFNMLKSIARSTEGKTIDTRLLTEVRQVFSRCIDAGYGPCEIENAYLAMRPVTKGLTA